MPAEYSPQAISGAAGLPMDMTANCLETVHDGVHYAIIGHAGSTWRLGSLAPNWRERVAALPVSPAPEELAALQEDEIWLEPGQPPKRLAVMCGGLGADWPGMGRELYRNFSAARLAMRGLDRLSDWDLLGIMRERDREFIDLVRWQIPYLFLLEYGQWMHFVSLGLRPDMLCGHSLGELTALCLAGVYEPDSAWYLMDTRAEHIAELEARAGSETGMLAVHADENIIRNVIASWPSLSVSNRNTPRQFILGGPVSDLMTARKFLRRQRIPAMMLNIKLAFHNPGMRILRSLSLRRLNALEIHAPRIPIISNVSTELYPDDRRAICELIANLDENTVAWTECVQAMWKRDGIRDFLELGPSETLCGLVREIIPEARCIACDGAGKELLLMRRACARLFAAGHLSFDRIRQNRETGAIADVAAAGMGQPPDASFRPEEFDPEKFGIFISLLSEAAGVPAAELGLEKDLRYDLALRSSSFPMLFLALEKRLGVKAELESLLKISTVGDLAALFLGRRENIAAAGEKDSKAAFAARKKRKPLARMRITGQGEMPAAEFMASKDIARLREPGEKTALIALDDDLLPELFPAFSSIGASMLARDSARHKMGSFAAWPAHLSYFPAQAPFDPEKICGQLLERHAAEFPETIVLVLPPVSEKQAPAHETVEKCEMFLERHAPLARLIAVQRLIPADAGSGDAKQRLALPPLRTAPRTKNVFFPDSGERHIYELGDKIVLETALLRAEKQPVLYEAMDNCAGLKAPPEYFSVVFPADSCIAEAGFFAGRAQFSPYGWPELAAHGINASYSPAGGSNAWLPYSGVLLAMLEGAWHLCPWLQLVGFTDVNFSSPPDFPAGITRECRLEALAMPWLMHDGMPTRMCRVRMELEKLSPNGRRSGKHAFLAAGTCLLSGHPLTVPPCDEKVSCSASPDVGGNSLRVFYDCMGFSGRWRLLENCGFAEAAPEIDGNMAGRPTLRLVAEIAPDGGSIAPFAETGYSCFFHMFEALVQGCQLYLALAGRPHDADASAMRERLSHWRLWKAGYLRLPAPNAEKPGAGRACLKLVPVWEDEKLTRFDAQVLDDNGRILLEARHIEFERTTAAPEEG